MSFLQRSIDFLVVARNSNTWMYCNNQTPTLGLWGCVHRLLLANTAGTLLCTGGSLSVGQTTGAGTTESLQLLHIYNSSRNFPIAFLISVASDDSVLSRRGALGGWGAVLQLDGADQQQV